MPLRVLTSIAQSSGLWAVWCSREAQEQDRWKRAKYASEAITCLAMLTVEQWSQGTTHWDKQHSDDFRLTSECPKSKKAAPQSFTKAGCHLSREYLTLQKFNSWNSCLCSWEANFQEHGLKHLQVVCVSIPHRFVLSQFPGLSTCQQQIDNCTSTSCENIW